MRQVIFYHYVNEFRTYLYNSQGFHKLYFGAKENNAVTLRHSAQRKHGFLGKIMEKSKINKLPARNRIALELLHQILGYRYTRSLLAGDTANIWEYIELIIDPDLFCTSCQISSTNKTDRYKNPLKPKAPFKWIFMDIIPSASSKTFDK